TTLSGGGRRAMTTMRARRMTTTVGALGGFAPLRGARSSDDRANGGLGTAPTGAPTTEATTEDTTVEVAVPDTVVEDDNGDEVDLSELDTRVEGAEDYSEILVLPIDDIQDYWATELPDVY